MARFVSEVTRLMPHLSPFLEAHDAVKKEEEEKQRKT